MAAINCSGSAAPVSCAGIAHDSPRTLELTLYGHQDGRYAAAMPGADFSPALPSWHRACQITLHLQPDPSPSPSPAAPAAAGGATATALESLALAESTLERLSLSMDALMTGLLALLPVDLPAERVISAGEGAKIYAARVLARDVVPNELADLDAAMKAIATAVDVLRSEVRHG